MQVKFRVEAASVAVHRHHRDSDQASPDSADADQSCRRHIQTGLALLSVPVLACKMQHMQQSLQMVRHAQPAQAAQTCKELRRMA